MGAIAAAIGLVGTFVKGLFGMKKSQADVITGSLQVLQSEGSSDSQRAQAASQAIDAVYRHGGWLERTWRPLAMVFFLVIIVSRLFGYMPPGISEAEMMRVYDMFNIGLIGYIPLRTVEKLVRSFQVGNILKTFVQKKIL